MSLNPTALSALLSQYGKTSGTSTGGYQQPQTNYNFQPSAPNQLDKLTLDKLKYYFQYQPREGQTHNQTKNFYDERNLKITDVYNILRNMYLTNNVGIQPIVNVKDNVYERVNFKALEPIVNYSKPQYFNPLVGQEPNKLHINLGGQQLIQGYGQSYGGGGYGQSVGGYGGAMPTGYGMASPYGAAGGIDAYAALLGGGAGAGLLV